MEERSVRKQSGKPAATISQREAVDLIAPHTRTGERVGEHDSLAKGRVRKAIAEAIRKDELNPLPGRTFNREEFIKWASERWPPSATDRLGPGAAAFRVPKRYGVKARASIGQQAVKMKGRVFIYPFTPSGFAACHERLASLQRQVLSLRSELADLKRERDVLKAEVDRLRQAVATTRLAAEKR
jgi:hypothetical protein